MEVTPRPEPAVTRPAEWSDVPALVSLLARAFAQDPFYRWLVLPDSRRDQRLGATFELFLRQMSGNLNETHVTGAPDGCAVWRRPGEHKLSLLQQLKLLPAFARIMGLSRIPNGLKLLEAMDQLHERLAPEPHFYLFVLGVEPARQGQGLGAQLLEPILKRCDREGQRAFLETSEGSNVAFYERRGFTVRDVLQRPPWPTFWCMIREAR
jgi:ribosomal protein S18 acetylase RimI-like enzyme